MTLPTVVRPIASGKHTFDEQLASNARSCLAGTSANARSPWEVSVSAVAYSLPRYGQRPHLELLPARPRPSAQVYRRRRVVALVVLIVGLALAAQLAGAVITAVSHGEKMSSSATAVRVVQTSRSWTVGEGDTLWRIVSATKPGQDPRPVVDQLSRARHGAPLHIGDKIVVP